MAHLRLVSTGLYDGIADAHRTCVLTIVQAVEQGVFSEAEADHLIDRVRALNTSPARRARTSTSDT